MFDLNNSVTIQRGNLPSSFFESIGNQEVRKEKNRIADESYKQYTVIHRGDSKWVTVCKGIFVYLPHIVSIVIKRFLNYRAAPGAMEKFEKTLENRSPTNDFINQTVKDVFRQHIEVNNKLLQEEAWKAVKNQLPKNNDPLVEKYLNQFKNLYHVMEIFTSPNDTESKEEEWHARTKAQELVKRAVENHIQTSLLPDCFNALKSKVGYINADKTMDLLSQTFNNHVCMVLTKKYSEKLPGMPINCNWQEGEGISRGETSLNTETLSFNENYRVGTSTGDRSTARACINVKITVDLKTFNAHIEMKVFPAKDISPEEATMMNKAWKTSFKSTSHAHAAGG